jgi:MSHA biogenesis protein MshO
MQGLSRVRGFTLIELVAVIIILGVVGTAVVSFIGFSAQIFVDVNSRDKALSDSRFVVERLNRELRDAIPNSIRLLTDPGIHCLEFMPIEWSTFYLNLPVEPAPASNRISAVVLSSNITEEAYVTANATSNFAILYPLTPADIYALNSQKRQPLQNIEPPNSDNVVDVVLANTVQFTTAAESPASRLYIGGQPVSYCVSANGQIRRHTDYGIRATQSSLFSTGGAVMGENLQNVLSADSLGVTDNPFRIINPTLRRNAFVHILFRFARADQPNEVLVFSSEVQVANVP